MLEWREKSPESRKMSELRTGQEEAAVHLQGRRGLVEECQDGEIPEK